MKRIVVLALCFISSISCFGKGLWKNVKVGEKIYTTEFSNIPHKEGRCYQLSRIDTEESMMFPVLYFDIYDNDKLIIKNYKIQADVSGGADQTYFKYCIIPSISEDAMTWELKTAFQDTLMLDSE